MVTATYLYEPFILVRRFVFKLTSQNGGDGLSRRRNEENSERGKISVSEAGRRGGAKGGPRVRELIEEGKEHENE
jgi:hypothetical protein